MKATEEEMIYHCDHYVCGDCPISGRCSMYESLLKGVPGSVLGGTATTLGLTLLITLSGKVQRPARGGDK